MSSRCELIFALDLPDRESAVSILEKAGPALSWVKIGLTLFCKYGPPLVEEIAARGYRIFLDLKLYDIPHQVNGTVRSLCSLPVELITLHTSGGEAMMRAAVKARNDSGSRLKLLGVTVLTSFDASGLQATGIQVPLEDQVVRLAALGMASGLDGLVCSPLELGVLRRNLGHGPILLTPGIRPAGSDSGDQKRIMTPGDAARKGSSFIVVGRPILQAEDPATVVESISAQLS